MVLRFVGLKMWEESTTMRCSADSEYFQDYSSIPTDEVGTSSAVGLTSIQFEEWHLRAVP